MSNKQAHPSFTPIDSRDLDEIESSGHLYIHEGSGARLLYLANDDANKVFGIGFRTPSDNSTGVAHILEHSVLNGSRKYQTKEPFMDMAKSSLQTFLNAMTFSDKTIYPVASRNLHDFKNLVDVYLDAVFYPSIYDQEEIFLQEGWHYHLEKLEDPISYRGVVYNEMRGALSGADAQVLNKILAALYPDSFYGKESGGDPYEIPDLTYEDFLDFHRTHYDPSNAYIFVYGDLDIEAFTTYLHEDYLSHFKGSVEEVKIEKQAPFQEEKVLQGTYSIAPDENPEGKDYFAFAVLAGQRQNIRDLFTLEVLSDALVDSQGAPLRQALLKAGIGADISCIGGDGIQIPFGVLSKETDANRFEDFRRIIDETLDELIDKGIDKELLRASLKKIEFDLREASGYATKGIIYYIQALETWLYDSNPFDILGFEPHLKALHEALETDYFETYLSERIRHNPHKVFLQVQAEPGKNARKDEALTARLAELKAEASENELVAMQSSTERLLIRQNSEDTPEAQATIPKLTREDIRTELEETPKYIEHYGPADLIHVPLFTSGISYIDLYFDCAHLSAEDLQDFSLLTSLFGAMDTERYSFAELDTAEHLHTGGISIVSQLLRNYHEPETQYLKIAARTKMIGSEGADFFFDYLKEVLTSTKISDKIRLRDVIAMLRARYETAIYRQGHRVMANRVCSYFSSYHRKDDRMSGLDYFYYLQDLDKNFDERVDELISRLEKLRDKLLTKDKLVCGITSSKEDYDALKPKLQAFIDWLPEPGYAAKNQELALEALNEGIKSSAGVQYVAKGAAFDQAYNGTMEVLSNLVSNEYLYNQIRAKGGAYGQGLSITSPGVLYAYSYRDPNLGKTLEVFDGMADFVADLKLSEEELLPYIIGVMNRFDPARTAEGRGHSVVLRHITGKTHADVQRNHQEALNSTVEGLKELAPVLENAMAKDMHCALGNAQVIEEGKELFDHVYALDQGQV